MCGLKYSLSSNQYRYLIVTPLAGVWIEIELRNITVVIDEVTPLAGVWIEITIRLYRIQGENRHTPRGCVD